MSHTIMLHALAKGETRVYMAQLITAEPDTKEGREIVAKAKAWAEGEGFHSFTEKQIEDGAPPDFSKVRTYEQQHLHPKHDRRQDVEAGRGKGPQRVRCGQGVRRRGIHDGRRPVLHLRRGPGRRGGPRVGDSAGYQAPDDSGEVQSGESHPRQAAVRWLHQGASAVTPDIDNTQDILDSRDVIKRYDELESERDAFNYDDDGNRTTADWATAYPEEAEELKALSDFIDEGSDEWRHGETLIRDSYFEDYAMELAEDIHGDQMRGLAWPLNCIDWEQAARELQMDYSGADFGGVTYWYRS